MAAHCTRRPSMEKFNRKAFGLLSDTATDLEQFRHYVNSHGVDVNGATNESGNTFLYLAAKTGQHRIVKFLVDRGVDVETRGEGGFTALHIASVYGHFKCCQLLVSVGASLDTRDDVYASCPLVAAAYWGYQNIVQLFCTRLRSVAGRSAKYGYGPLTLAAFKGYLRIAEILLKRGADVHERTRSGNTPLLVACGQGHVDVARLLLEHGASATETNDSQQTTLHCAAYYGANAVVSLLLNNDARVNATNAAGATSLHIACRRGHVDVAKTLLGSGADPRLQDGEQRTPLHYAVQRKNMRLVELLLQLHAPIDLADVHGYTVLDLLTERQRRSLKTLSCGERLSLTLPPPLQQHDIDIDTCDNITLLNHFMQLSKRQFPLLRGLTHVQRGREIFLPQKNDFYQILSKDAAQSEWLLVCGHKGQALQVYDPMLYAGGGGNNGGRHSSCAGGPSGGGAGGDGGVGRDNGGAAGWNGNGGGNGGNGDNGPGCYSVETLSKLASLLNHNQLKHAQLNLDIMDVQQVLQRQQTAIFSMAFTTDLLHGIDPSPTGYGSISQLKLHLRECFRTRMLTPFTKQRSNADLASNRRPQSLPEMRAIYSRTMARHSNERLVKQRLSVALHCLCHMPRDGSMQSCEKCTRLYHPHCLFGQQPIMTPYQEGGPLLCLDCIPRNPTDLIQMLQPNLENPNLKYDLYISYSSEDLQFVQRELLRRLDRRGDGNGDSGGGNGGGEGVYDLLVSDRDWPVGGPLADSIVAKLTQSAKALAVISAASGSLMQHSVQRFTHYECQMMLHHKPNASAVLLLDPPEQIQLSGYLRTLLTSGRCLHWSDDPQDQHNLWKTLRQFLGEPLHQRRSDP